MLFRSTMLIRAHQETLADIKRVNGVHVCVADRATAEKRALYLALLYMATTGKQSIRGAYVCLEEEAFPRATASDGLGHMYIELLEDNI